MLLKNMYTYHHWKGQILEYEIILLLCHIMKFLSTIYFSKVDSMFSTILESMSHLVYKSHVSHNECLAVTGVYTWLPQSP